MTFDVEGWPWQPDLCPADLHLMEWLDEQPEGSLKGKAILHMGPGLHHMVGLAAQSLDMNYLGITVSSAEFNSAVAHTILCNIYDLAERLNRLAEWRIEVDDLPIKAGFDILTLFHVGEMEDRFGPIQPEKIRALIDMVKPGGVVIFYEGSSAWDRFGPIVENWENSVFEPFWHYRTLQLARKH